MDRVINKGFDDLEIPNCLKCGSDQILRTVKDGYRRTYNLFCYKCAHNVSAANVRLCLAKWDGTHVTVPSEVKPLPCYMCEGEVMIKKKDDKYHALCKNCGKAGRSRLTRWDATKLHNSNYRQISTKKKQKEQA